MFRQLGGALFALILVCACESAEESLADAERAFARGDLTAYDMFVALEDDSAVGRKVRSRLAEADHHYREGIERYAEGADGAREELALGLRVAPMDPSLYLPLARALAAHDLLERAAACYLKFLALRPDDREAGAARRELEALRLSDPSSLGTLAAAPPPASATSSVFVGLGIGLAAGLAIAAALAFALIYGPRPSVSLEKLVAKSPELHPAIAYLVGQLRHELLKHRIGAIGDAVTALASGNASKEESRFLEARLFGGEPLESAFAGHLLAFERALGPQAAVARDPRFRRAGRAFRDLARLAPRIAKGDVTATRELSRAHATLREFDAALELLAASLVRTSLDEALLRGIVNDVRSEYAPSLVELQAFEVRLPAERCVVDVFRVDLVLVLKNVVRNAILAMSRDAPPRKLAIDVRIELEATGEETVRIRVSDTNEGTLTTEAIYDRAMSRGLGLVTAALARYDGAVEVEEGLPTYAKGVTVRFFRSLEGDA